MRRAFALSALLALLFSAPSLAASPAPAEPKKPSKPPSSLWGKYPLGNEKLKPLPATRTPAPVRSRSGTPAPAPAQTPPTISSGDAGGTSVPLWAVLLGALALSCVLGLAGESLVGRAKRLVRPPKAYEPAIQDAPAERSGDDQAAPEPSSVQPVESYESLSASVGVQPVGSDESLSASVGRLRAAAAALGYDDPKLQAVVEAVTVSGEWRPLALATVLSSWDEPAAAAQLARPEVSRSQSEGGMNMGDGYADLGNRVAAVLHAAEEVAARIREEALDEATAIRREAEDAATARVEHLTQEAEKVLAEAEAQARARREAAEETAARMEAEARKHQEDLNAAARSLEERLQKTLAGLERVSTNAEHVLTSAEQPAADDGNSAPQTMSA